MKERRQSLAGVETRKTPRQARLFEKDFGERLLQDGAVQPGRRTYDGGCECLDGFDALFLRAVGAGRYREASDRFVETAGLNRRNKHQEIRGGLDSAVPEEVFLAVQKLCELNNRCCFFERYGPPPLCGSLNYFKLEACTFSREQSDVKNLFFASYSPLPASVSRYPRRGCAPVLGGKWTSFKMPFTSP